MWIYCVPNSVSNVYLMVHIERACKRRGAPRPDGCGAYKCSEEMAEQAHWQSRPIQQRRTPPSRRRAHPRAPAADPRAQTHPGPEEKKKTTNDKRRTRLKSRHLARQGPPPRVVRIELQVSSRSLTFDCLSRRHQGGQGGQKEACRV